MNIPNDAWAKIGLAESLIRGVVTNQTEWPHDMSPAEMMRLERITDDLHKMLCVGV